MNFLTAILSKWNDSGFRPPLCTYRLNWATVLQTQDSKFEPWRSEAEHATSRSRRLPTILTFTRGRGRNIFVSFKPPGPWTEPRTLAWKAAVLTTTLGPPPAILSRREDNARCSWCWVSVGLGQHLAGTGLTSHLSWDTCDYNVSATLHDL